MTTYKCILMGDAGVGKTMFIRQLNGNGFRPKYDRTLGVQCTPVMYNDQITFDIWDCAGQEKFNGIERYYNGAYCAIIMFDVQSKLSYKSAQQFINSIQAVCPDIPYVLVGNKSELARKFSIDDCDCFISCRDNINITQPLALLSMMIDPVD